MGTAETDDFESIVIAYYANLYRFALSLSRSRDTAADLVQQAFLTFARKGHQMQDRSKVKSWLFTTLYREFLGWKKRQDRVAPLEDAHFANREGNEAEAPRDLDGKLALEALARLPETYRDPLTLFYVEDCSYREIADILGVPIGTVMSRLSRGEEELKRRLAV